MNNALFALVRDYITFLDNVKKYNPLLTFFNGHLFGRICLLVSVALLQGKPT